MAVNNKRYYWIQLTQDFFNSKEMKLLRKIAGGDTHTIIYLKMMLLSLEDNGRIYFDSVGDNLAEELSLVIDENVEDIKITLMFLEAKGLMSRNNEREYFLEQVPEMVGSETASARRVRKHREKQVALQSNSDVTSRNGDIEIEKEQEKKKEKEKESEKDKDINIDTEINTETKKETESEVDKDNFAADVAQYYQSRIGVIDGQQYQQLIEYVTMDHMEPELVKRAIDKAADNAKRNFGYINRILKNWAQNGIKTRVQQDEDQRRFNESKGFKKNVDPEADKEAKEEWGF